MHAHIEEWQAAGNAQVQTPSGKATGSVRYNKSRNTTGAGAAELSALAWAH